MNKPVSLIIFLSILNFYVTAFSSSSCNLILEKKSLKRQAWDWQGQMLFVQLDEISTLQSQIESEINQLTNDLASSGLTPYQKNKIQLSLNKALLSKNHLDQKLQVLQNTVVHSYSLGPSQLNFLQRKSNQIPSSEIPTYAFVQTLWEYGQFLFYLSEYNQAFDTFKKAAETALTALNQTQDLQQKQNLAQIIYFGLATKLIDHQSVTTIIPDPYAQILYQELPKGFNHQIGSNQDLNWNLKNTPLWLHLSTLVWNYWMDQAHQKINRRSNKKTLPTQANAVAELRQLLEQEIHKNPHQEVKLNRFLAILDQPN